jgi:hypothetical protein
MHILKNKGPGTAHWGTPELSRPASAFHMALSLFLLRLLKMARLSVKEFLLFTMFSAPGLNSHEVLPSLDGNIQDASADR